MMIFVCACLLHISLIQTENKKWSYKPKLQLY